MSSKTAVLPFLFLIAAPAFAQMPGPPGAEVKKLEYFVGTWSTEGTIAQGPWGMGGKFTSTRSEEWMPGNFFVQGHSDFRMPAEIGGDGKEVSLMGYDTDQSVYTFDSYNSQGRHESSKGSLNGDTWTWNSSQSYGGQEVQQKMTIKMLSPASYSLRFEVSVDGKNWMTFMDAKATRK
jgi:Protein of unknown function (DUF1579)